MTNQQHPITPPPDLVQQWFDEASELETPTRCHIATRAAQWGADQELDACCDWLVAHQWHGQSGACLVNLRTDRRPRPLSLKEQALAVLEEEPEDTKELIVFDTDQVNLIRRALQALPND